MSRPVVMPVGTALRLHTIEFSQRIGYVRDQRLVCSPPVPAQKNMYGQTLAVAEVVTQTEPTQ